MTKPKLTEAQARAIREARKKGGKFWNVTQYQTLRALSRKELAIFYRPFGTWFLTTKGWTVEVEDEDR